MFEKLTAFKYILLRKVSCMFPIRIMKKRLTDMTKVHVETVHGNCQWLR
jgi:hypothetical protein